MFDRLRGSEGEAAKNSLDVDARAILQAFSRETDFFRQKYEAFLEQYPEQWVAIFNREVVAAGPDMKEILRSLKRRNIPLDQVLLEYLTDEDQDRLWSDNP